MISALRTLRYIIQPNFRKYFFHHTSIIAGFKKGRGTGDQGKSSLYSGERRWKDDSIFHALGAVDELNSYIGICREKIYREGLFREAEVLLKVQCCLQDVGSHIATPSDASKIKQEKTKFDVSFYNFVNEQIDVYGDRTPPLRAFILPGGGELSSTLQYARAVCRRVERTIVPLLKAEAIDGDCLRFVNRLSDLLFILARYIASISGRKEAVYHRFQSDPESKITQIP